MASPQIPKKTTVLVIGGGPGGSYAATALAREGFKVTLLERDFFPRYHIGESMLPSCRNFLEFTGAYDRVANHGFCAKPGAAAKLSQHKPAAYTDFCTLGPDHGAWNVVRSEFDEILLRYASEVGVDVFEGVKVTDIDFKGADDLPIESKTPISASYKTQDGTVGDIYFDWLIDASGRSGIMASKYLKSRKFNQSLKNVAFWGYWKGTGSYSPGTDRENAPFFEALVDESGWAWFIPLHNGTTSVGLVINEDASRVKRAKHDNVKDYYHDQLKLVPSLMELVSPKAEFMGDIKTAGDYSYSSDVYAGPNYRLVGDAAAFIDPFFSSGVHLAFTGGLSAASSICASVRGDCTEKESIAYHASKVGVSYTRFLIVVLGVYRQMGAQVQPILSEVDGNFDNAFELFKPIIQGKADVNTPELSVGEIEATMDFCASTFFPKVARPAVPPPDSALSPMEISARNAQLTLRDQVILHDSKKVETMAGFYPRLEKGKLGLVKSEGEITRVGINTY